MEPVTNTQEIADRALYKIALQYGSTTRRDFRVIEIVLSELTAMKIQPPPLPVKENV